MTDLQIFEVCVSKIDQLGFLAGFLLSPQSHFRCHNFRILFVYFEYELTNNAKPISICVTFLFFFCFFRFLLLWNICNMKLKHQKPKDKTIKHIWGFITVATQFDRYAQWDVCDVFPFDDLHLLEVRFADSYRMFCFEHVY